MKFSVLIPVYHRENPIFLHQSLESITVNQTIMPSEIIIVEDGKLTPQLDNVLDLYQAKYSHLINRIKLPVNMGMGVAMNIGLKKATYNWIARMDSDDIAVPTRFEEQINYIEKNPHITILGSSIEEFNNSIGDLKRYRILPQNHNEIISIMKSRNPINHMTVFFKKEIALNAGGYWEYRFFEDYNLWYEMKKQKATFHNLQQILVFVRVGNDMVARRQGINYFKYEQILLKKFFNEHFITLWEYYKYIFIKFSLRVLPVKALNLIYTIFLRKNKPVNS